MPDVSVKVKVIAKIPSDFWVLLTNFRNERDDEKARLLIDKINKNLDWVVLNSFQAGLNFDITKHKPHFVTEE